MSAPRLIPAALTGDDVLALASASNARRRAERERFLDDELRAAEDEPERCEVRHAPGCIDASRCDC